MPKYQVSYPSKSDNIVSVIDESDRPEEIIAITLSESSNGDLLIKYNDRNINSSDDLFNIVEKMLRDHAVFESFGVAEWVHGAARSDSDDDYVDLTLGGRRRAGVGEFSGTGGNGLESNIRTISVPIYSADSLCEMLRERLLPELKKTTLSNNTSLSEAVLSVVNELSVLDNSGLNSNALAMIFNISNSIGSEEVFEAQLSLIHEEMCQGSERSRDATVKGVHELVLLNQDLGRLTTELLNKFDNRGYTALHYACMMPDQNVNVKALVCSANVNQKSLAEGRTAMHFLAIAGKTALIEHLERDIADIDSSISDSYGHTYKDYQNNPELAKSLGANGNHREGVDSSVDTNSIVNVASRGSELTAEAMHAISFGNGNDEVVVNNRGVSAGAGASVSSRVSTSRARGVVSRRASAASEDPPRANSDATPRVVDTLSSRVSASGTRGVVSRRPRAAHSTSGGGDNAAAGAGGAGAGANASEVLRARRLRSREVFVEASRGSSGRVEGDNNVPIPVNGGQNDTCCRRLMNFTYSLFWSKSPSPSHHRD